MSSQVTNPEMDWAGTTKHTKPTQLHETQAHTSQAPVTSGDHKQVMRLLGDN